MRLALAISILLLLSGSAYAQKVKPRIVGQKELTTPQDQPITIRLSDLQVEEVPVEGDDDQGSDEGDRDEDDDDGDDGDSGGSDDDGDRDDDKGDKDDRDDKKDKGDKKDKKDKGEKGDKKDKGDKGKDRGKNGRSLYPENYVLEIFPGQHYTFSGTTVTPDRDFAGTLTVPVSVRNQHETSPKYDVKITVTAKEKPKNQPPVITGQRSLSTAEDTPLTVQLSDLTVTDPDNTYPEGFLLKVLPGENYTINNTTIIPGSGYTGTLTVPVVVNDGKDNSQPYPVKITVIAKAGNVPPEIVGQVPLSISTNQPVAIVLAHLVVRDPDHTYPEGFTLKVHPGPLYSVSGTTVTPAKDYTGDLQVSVSVHDGINESKVYDLKVNVAPGPNFKPVITGQTGLKIPSGESLVIRLSHLVVEDHDNRYPEDFSLVVSSGENFHAENNEITPSENFLGILTVPVVVSDGKDASDPYQLSIEVFAKDQLAIVGQRELAVPEESVFSPQLNDLLVNDPAGKYPEGFSLVLYEGNDYDLVGGKIRPQQDFAGNLTVPVKISTDGRSSAPFDLLVVVTPVNDAPVLAGLEQEPLSVSGNLPVQLTASAEIQDADDDHLLYGEISFDPHTYRSGKDRLEFEPHKNINAVFDDDAGVLYLLGHAPLEEYTTLLRSIQYRHDGDSLPATGQKKVLLRFNDGKENSVLYERTIVSGSHHGLDIPTAFTPNNDQANDTWKIMLRLNPEDVHATVRVYDRRGNIVFESRDLEEQWDGHFNGAPLPADVYFYIIDVDLSYQKVSYKGAVSILR